jgi:PAS domain S-box-containing protein
MIYQPRRHHLLFRISLLLMLVALALLTYWLVVRADREMRDELLQQTRVLAKAVNLDHLKTFSGSAADLDNSNYQEIKKQLMAVRFANPQCRFLYLTGRKADGTVFFFVDSDPTNSPDYSPPGQSYEEVSATFRHVFDTKTGVVEGPIPDRWGKWVSALSPVADPETGAVFAVLGMDVDARNWNWHVFTRSAPLAGLMVAVGTIILLLYRSNVNISAQREKLKKSELHLQTILESTADGILAMDNEGKMIKINQRFKELWQISPSILQNSDNRELVNFITSQQVNPELALQRVESLINSPVFDFAILHCQDGRIIERTFTPMMLDGKQAGRLWVCRDATARQRAEESHARLATAVEQSAEAVVITDLKGTILYANPAFEQVSGYTHAEVIGQHSRLIKSGKQDDTFYRRLWETLEHGEVWAGHFVNRHKNGSLYEEDAIISPVRDAAGNIVNYVAVKRDMTREMQLQDQLRQAQKMEAIGQLAGGVAHDFNNILTSLLLQIELVGQFEPLPAGVSEGLMQIREDTKRAAKLTRQLLLFSRRQVMQPHNLDLNEVVTNLTQMLQRIIGEDVQMQLQLHPEPLVTRADAGMLDQVLMNLTVNARDAMPTGGQLRIGTSEKIMSEGTNAACPEAVPGRYVCLSVSDTGGGISPEILPHIFEPFFTTKAAGKGTGLGLATVFGIVKQHHGWIDVDNRPGKGVTFQIFLPASGTTDKESISAPLPAPSRDGTETILLVEDEAALRKLMCKILKRHGYQVLEASNGVEALDLWSEHGKSVTLLLTDLVMPGGLDGQELARQLQAKQPALKVVFSSGYSIEIAGREISLRHGENFLPKPFTPDRLLKSIRQCLDA